MTTRAVFLDRDGTLIHDPGYLADPSGVVLFDDVGDALRSFVDAGFALVVCTNQSGIARGRYDEPAYRRVAKRLDELLASEGVSLLATYFCPFHPEGTVPAYARDHDDRKPAPGMWLRAAADHGIDLAASYSLGDGERDVVAGKRAGTTTVLIAGGRDKWPLPVDGPYDADFTARDIREAAIWIQRREGLRLPRHPGAPLSTRVAGAST